MQLIDTHAHLFSKQFDSDLPEVIARARMAGVGRILLPNIDSSTIAKMHATVLAAPDLFLPMMGLHPCDVKDDWETELSLIGEALRNGNYVAVGEIGLDMYWDKTRLAAQTIVFEQHLEWAKERSLPVSVHSRDAYPQVLQSIEKVQDGRLRGVLHCFTGTQEQAERLIGLGFHLGIGGVVTFKNSGLDKVIPELPLDRLVLETDAPYLAPVPFRGKRNESAHLIHIAQKVADLRGITLEEVAAATSSNALHLFNLN